MRVGILARVDKPQAAPLALSIHGALTHRGVEVLLERQIAEACGMGDEGLDEATLAARSDLLLVLGGDGTILRALHQLGNSVPPVFGINLGSLGFLTGVSSEDWPRAVESIAAGDFQLSVRTLLQIEQERDGKIIGSFQGLNDAVVSRGQHSQLIRVEVWVDGEELCVYNADGLIVSTPTGSTAYSMSAGGPLLLPNSACFVLTPICPHVLTNRSTVVADTARLELRLVGGGPGVTVNVDGRIARDFAPGDVLRMMRSEETFRLATLPGRTFSDVLREKLKWSGSNV